MEECLSSRTDNLPVRMKSGRQKAKVSLFHVLLCGLPPGGLAKFGVSLSTSNDPTKKKNPLHPCPAAWFELIPDVFKLTTKISHHTSK